MTEIFYKKIIDESPLGYAYHKIVCDDEGVPVDYVFLEVNAAFEKFTGLSAKDVVGKRATEIFPNIQKSEFDWIKEYGDIALNGKKREFDSYSEPLNQWYSLVVYSPEKGYFISLLRNISELIKKEEAMLEIENRYHTIFDHAPIGLTNISMEGNLLEVNGAFCKMLGYTRKELLSMNFVDITYDEDQNISKEGAIKMEEGIIPVFHIKKRYIHKSGSIVWADVASTLWHDAEGAPSYFINMVSDITEQKREEEHKLYIDNLIKEMGQVAKIGGWEFDLISGKWSWTEEVAKIHDLDPNILTNVTANLQYYTSEAQCKIEAARKEAIEHGTPYSLELEFISAKGIKKWVKTIGKPVFKNGKAIKLQGAFQDITDRKEAELALRKSESKYRLITENVADVISIYNITKKEFVYVSPSVERLRGISVEEAMKENIEESVLRENFKPFVDAIAKNVDDFMHNPKASNYYVNELQQLCKNGKSVWVEISTKYQYNSDGEIEAVNIIRNIEERKKAERAMLDLSYRDQLTGLYNRRFYEAALKRLNTEENLPLALVMADVNELKYTNDAFGHQEGDLILQRIAEILKEVCRKDDVVSRIGGDEFVILLPKTGRDDVQQFISRIHSVVSKENKERSICSLSIGFGIKESSNENMDQTFKNAEDEMYKYKFTESASMRNRSTNLIKSPLFIKAKEK